MLIALIFTFAQLSCSHTCLTERQYLLSMYNDSVSAESRGSLHTHWCSISIIKTHTDYRLDVAPVTIDITSC
ncbi:hypothetical protein BDZ97DRAFT_1852781 [Flammula alnicola]|nr:hypothetical protein BDZ97DRAFT_1871769 [Flammula alnicola]KAF8956225.1 hypothetical protein BDZ97DRAFT_1852781 [Flammula alnicola]